MRELNTVEVLNISGGLVNYPVTTNAIENMAKGGFLTMALFGASNIGKIGFKGAAYSEPAIALAKLAGVGFGVGAVVGLAYTAWQLAWHAVGGDEV